MKSYDELKANIEITQRRIVEAMKYESTEALNETICLWEEFGFAVIMLKDSLTEGQKQR